MSKIPDRLGKYRLLRILGYGNACQVFEAVNDATGVRYAVKALPPKLNDKTEAAHLKHEFEIARNFNHPNVIRVFEHNIEGSVIYVVMDVFSSLNVKQALREGSPQTKYHLPSVIEGCATGLSYIHTQGCIHCDVKPDNFLVNDKAEIKLIDFTIAQKIKKGLSKIFGGRSKVAGTRSYMSPEQIRGEHLDERSDLYSFGCVVYELATGKPPYTGTSPNDLLQKHLSASIPWAPVSSENITSEFADLIKRCMNKERARRPSSMADFLKEFRTIRLYKVPPTPPVTNETEPKHDS